MKTIFEQWESYRRGVLSPNAPELQVQECRMAFYAGAMAHFSAVEEISATCRTDDEGAKMIQKLLDEIQGFAAAIAGKKNACADCSDPFETNSRFFWDVQIADIGFHYVGDPICQKCLSLRIEAARAKHSGSVS